MKILSRLKIEGSGFKLRKFNMKYFPSKENSNLTDKQITGISKAAAFSLLSQKNVVIQIQPEGIYQKN